MLSRVLVVLISCVCVCVCVCVWGLHAKITSTVTCAGPVVQTQHMLHEYVILLYFVMITGTVMCTGNNSEDVVCAGQNYVATMPPVLVGLLHL